MINNNEPGCDVLVVSPHTDDAEISLGGTLALLAARGRRVWCLDLTRGELGTNAGCDERWAEAAAASEILGLAGRLQLALPDGFIAAADRGQAEAIVWVLRSLRPRWVFTAPAAARHPDHVAAPLLTGRACFLSRLVSLQPDRPEMRTWAGGQEPPPPAGSWIPETVCGVCGPDDRPDLVFDVTGHQATKRQALACYASQFRQEPGRRPTRINEASFLEQVERRDRARGDRVGCTSAEFLCTAAVPVLRDLPELPWRQPW